MWPRALLAGLLFVSAAHSQPAFEVTSIRPAESHTDPTFVAGIKISGTSVVMRNVSVETLVRAAYGVQARFLSSGALLKDQPRFDIRALLPTAGAASQIPQMVETMLKDRFKLAVHFERQGRQVYALLPAGGGPKLHKATVDETRPGGAFSGVNAVSDEGSSRVWTSPDTSSMRITPLADGGGRWDLTGVSLAEFAMILNTTDGLDVLDMTGIAGKYDLTFTNTPEELCEVCTHAPNPQQNAGELNLRESLRRLGLRLEKRQETVEVMVIDHLDKLPDQN